MTLPRPVLHLAAAVAAAALLAACGGGTAGRSTGSSPSAGVAETAPAEESEEVLTFPAEYGLPDLTPPDGGDVSPASGEDDGYVAFEVSGVEADEALATFGDQLREAGFELVESGASIQAGKEDAATVTVVVFGDGVMVDAEPPS
ncbi:hypothetical protein [Klenkia sp. PcliD-1-E]|uniref:hypothetical protein n=1 Tax=Klenkia sp. PcliD-1-E TaxID=2954492 RepID=UPI002097C54A|nr:hypothetical protein [Klenkia sp. PcliD-1-E]MCO7221170.1 hypothetical protein [Klenkia sp. PcliD-1-E]